MRRPSETTRQTIVAAARQLFLTHGYSAVSVDVIAIRAGITKQTLYRYFPGKRTLFLAVIEAAVAVSSALDTPPVLNTVDDLRPALLAIATHINAVIADPDYIQLLRVVISETITHPDLGLLFKRGITARALKALTRLFKQANTAGVTIFGRPENAARLFVGTFTTRILLDGLLSHLPQKQIKKLTQRQLKQYVDEFMRYASS